MNLFQKIASTWNRSDRQVASEAATRQPRRTPASHDKTDSIVANRALTKALYYNEYPGMKLAGALAYNPIAIPVMFMGTPVAQTDDKELQAILQKLLDSAKPESVHTESHRDGTAWLWPYWDEKARRVRVEYIPDDQIKVITDLTTGDIIKIVSVVELEINDLDNNSTHFVTRTRVWTADKITESYDKQVSDKLKSTIRRNVTRSFPIPFANNQALDEIRGRSDYSRIVVDLKNYHDISYAQSELLARFKAKWKQGVGKNPAEWLRNNGYASIVEFDPMSADFVFNADGEDTEILSLPATASNGHEAALKRTWRTIVEGSGVPEICWGLKTEGNHASVEEQMGILVQFVKAKRKQATGPWEEYLRQATMLYAIGNMTSLPAVDYWVDWGTLDGLSDKTKSEIFGQFADGVAKLIGVGGITKRQLYNLYKDMYPEATDMSLEEFVRRMGYMAKHNQYRNSDYIMLLDMFNEDPEGGDPEEGNDE